MRSFIYGFLFMALQLNINAAPLDLTDSHNLSFEKDSLGTVTVPKGWIFAPSPRVKCEIVTEKMPDAGGRHSLKVDYSSATSADASRMFLSGFIPIDPKLNYILSLRLKTFGKTAKGFGVSFGQMFYGRDKKIISYKDFNLKRLRLHNIGNLNWELFTFPLTPAKSEEIAKGEIPPNATYARIFFMSYGYDRPYIIDDLRLEPARSGFADSTPADNAVVRIGYNGNAPETASGFVRTVCAPEKSVLLPADRQTKFQISKTADHVLIKVDCSLPKGTTPKVAVKTGGIPQVCNDEAVEVFLDASGERRLMLQIAVNADGAVYESFNHTASTSEASAKVTKTTAGWHAEIKIPLKKLWQLYHEAGSELNRNCWNINVCRHQPGAPAGMEYSSWQYTGNGFHSPQKSGLLLLKKENEVLKDIWGHTLNKLNQQLTRNADLLKDNPLPAIKKIQKKLQAEMLFAKAMNQALKKQNKIPVYVFSRSYSEATKISARVGNILDELRRMSFSLPDKRKKYGYLWFKMPLTADVSPYILPASSKELIDKISLRGARGEIKAVRFSLFTSRQLKKVELTWGDLQSKSGKSISKDSIGVYILEPWGSDHQADLLATDLNIPFKGYLKAYNEQPRRIPVIPVNTSRHFIVKVKIPTDQEPGIYTGCVKVSGSFGSETFPIQVEVLDFKLKAASKQVGFYSHAVIRQPNGPKIGTRGAMFYNGTETPETMYENLHYLTESGFNYVNLCDYAGGALNAKYSRQLLEISKKAGFSQVGLMGSEHAFTTAVVTAPPSDPKRISIEKLMNERYAQIAKMSKELGMKVFIYGFDEPHDADGIARANAIFKLAKAHNLPTATAVIFDAMRVKLKDLDTVVMSYMGMTSSHNKLLDKILAGKSISPLKSVICYNNMQNKTKPMVRMVFGWYLFRTGLDGNVPWAYYYLGKDWDAFHDWGKGNMFNNSVYIIPTKDRPVSTLKFEAAREGVNDLRYLEQIQNELKSLADRKLAAELEGRLKKLASNIEPYNLKGTESNNFKIPPAQYDLWRKTLVDILITLSKKKKK